MACCETLACVCLFFRLFIRAARCFCVPSSHAEDQVAALTADRASRTKALDQASDKFMGLTDNVVRLQARIDVWELARLLFVVVVIAEVLDIRVREPSGSGAKARFDM